ncbi:MAG: formylglycine-generating enzyme family protein [Fuerstiella sp.]
MKTFGFSQGHREKVAIVRISPLVLLLFAMLGCGSRTDPAKPPDAATVKKHMTPAQLALGDPVVNSVGMLLVPIPAGTFTMGGVNGGKPHPVTLTKPFELSVHEVTEEQYENVMGARPWQGKDSVKEGAVPDTRRVPVAVRRTAVDGADYPATWVSHDDAVAFCRKLSKQEGVEYRLPTEAEWEYACRAGTQTAYSFGDSESELGDYAWYAVRTTYPVGSKKPNAWGLYDMHGNVFEWCEDWYGSYPSGSVTDPTGASSGSDRVIRGGCWRGSFDHCRSANRNRYSPGIRHDFLGFRVLRSSIQ